VSSTHAKEIEKIQQIIYRGEYNKALEKLNILVEDVSLNDDESIKTKIVLSRILKLVNQHNLALEYIEKLLKNKIVKKNPLYKIEVLILLCDVLLLMVRENRALTAINEVDELIDEYKKENKNGEIKRLEAYHNFVKGNAFLRRGHTKEAIHQMTISLELWKELDNKQEIARVMRNIGKCHSDRGEFDKAIELLEESYKISMSIKNVIDSIHPLGYIAEIHYKRGEIDKTIEYYKKRLELSEKAEFTYGIISSNFFIGFGYCALGDFKKARKHLKISLDMAKETNHYRMQGLSLGAFALAYKLEADFDKALKYYNEAIEAYEKIGYKHYVAECLNNIGDIHLLKGESAKALTIFKKSLLIFEEVGRNDWIINTQRNIGDVYVLLGDLDEALTYYFKALDYYNRRSYKIQVSQCMYNIGGVYWSKGDLNEAKKYLDDSLALIKDIGNDIITAQILLDLITINIENFDLPIASKHFMDLHVIDERLGSKLVNQQKRFAEALIYMNSDDKREQGKAELLLEQLATEEVLHHSLTVNALLSLCESYLDKYRDSVSKENQSNILKDLNKLVERLEVIANEFQAVSLLAETYWLKYQLLILDDRNEAEAEIFMLKADEIAREYELTNLINKFAVQKNILEFEQEEKKDVYITGIDKRDIHEELKEQLDAMRKDIKKPRTKVRITDTRDRPVYEFTI